MTAAPALVLILAAAGVGVLHTVVPDHWAPIALIARQQRWTSVETARRALLAGIGHVVSTLALGIALWLTGMAFADRFGHTVRYASSAALVAFGAWVAIGALRELREDANEPCANAERAAEKKRSLRTSVLLIAGASPMVEALPLFFAAAKFGIGPLVAMAAVLAATTIATYVALCVYSVAHLQRMRFGAFERYGEVMSGALIALIGGIFFFVPVF